MPQFKMLINAPTAVHPREEGSGERRDDAVDAWLLARGAAPADLPGYVPAAPPPVELDPADDRVVEDWLREREKGLRDEERRRDEQMARLRPVFGPLGH